MNNRNYNKDLGRLLCVLVIETLSNKIIFKYGLNISGNKPTFSDSRIVYSFWKLPNYRKLK